jgi:predicted permease
MPRELLRRLTALIRWRRHARGLQDEMALHLDLRTQQNLARGLSSSDAAGQARRTFGSSLSHHEHAREAWGWMWLDRVSRDIRLAVRSLGRTPAFTAGTVLSLSLGLAITSAAIAVTNAYLLRAMPYPESDRVYHVMYAPSGPWEPNNLGQLDWTTTSDLIEFPLVSSAETFNMADDRVVHPLRGRRVTLGIVSGLNARMSVGRMLNDSDFAAPHERPDLQDQPALIGHAVWRDRFGADASIVDRVITTETEAGRQERFRIVGVLPPDFYVGGESRQPIEMVVPFTARVRTYYMVRLREGVPASVVEDRLTRAVREISTDLPSNWTGVHLESARERYSGQVRPILIGVTSAAALVLAIVFANVAVLTVLRTMRRQAEVAVRLALGSSRGQLARLLATELWVIVLASVVLGLLATHLGLGVLASSIEAQIGRPAPGGTPTIGVDVTVWLIVCAIAVICLSALSILPLFVVRSGALANVLRKASASVTAGRAAGRVRAVLLAGEVAVTLVLLVGCGLMVRSTMTMIGVDLGFDANEVARARIVLRPGDYGSGAEYSRFFDQFTRRASAATGFPVAFSSWPAFAEFPERAIEIDGRPGHVLSAGAVNAAPAYFATLGIRVREGRDFTWDDVSGPAAVAVISESLARRLWPGARAIGKQVRQIEITAGGERPPGPWQTVVGVVADVRQRYGDPNLNDIYSPWLPDFRYGSFFIRNGGRIDGLVSNLRASASAIDPRAVVDLFHPLSEDNRELSATTFLSGVLVVFAGLAAFVALVGIYAVTASAAQQREREVAIRMALGAGRPAVVWLFVRAGLIVSSIGLVLGVVAASAATRLVEHQVFAIGTFDRQTMATMAVMLAIGCLVATWWPARRASRRSLTDALKDV